MITFVAFALMAQEGGIFGRVFPNPTGRNGYEEYVRGGDLLASDEADLFASYEPKSRPDPDLLKRPGMAVLWARIGKMEPLAVAREARQKFGPALQWIGQGNQKPIQSPWTVLGPDTPFPEFRVFRRFGGIAALSAWADAAEGRTDVACRTLLESLVFASSIRSFGPAANAAGRATESAVYRAFGDLLPRLSRRDASAIAMRVSELLARTSPIRGMVQETNEMTMGSVGKLLSSKLKADDLKGDDPDMASLRKAATMNDAERESLKREILEDLRQKETAVVRILKGPESGWIAAFTAFDEGADAKGADAAEGIVHFLYPHLTQLVAANLRSRTQLRLLSLHARLIQYRWDWNRWPKTIDEIDPLTEGRYVYETSPEGIRLASRGTPETGEIELKYRRVADKEKSQP